MHEDYQHERTGWLAAISHLQEELAELSRAVAARMADMKSQVSREREIAARQAQLEAEAERERQIANALREENRQLTNKVEKDRRERPLEDKQTKQALEDLVTELMTIKVSYLEHQHTSKKAGNVRESNPESSILMRLIYHHARLTCFR